MEQTAVQTELNSGKSSLSEELSRMTPEDAALLEKLKAAEAAKASRAETGADAEKEEVLCDEYGFPFEPEGYYNSAPLEFEEVAKALWVVLNNLNYTATRYNRLSPYYPILMTSLEKDIKQMGSYCITKTVLEQSGESFPGLDHITVKELVEMASVMFRKCCGAYDDLQGQQNTQDMSIIAWIFRWAGLVDRLKATQDKINKIKSGEIKIEPLLKRETVYKGEPKMQRDHSHHKVGPVMRASALPVLKSFTAEVKAQVRDEEKQERARQREAERAQKRLDRELDRGPMYRPQYIRPKSYPVLPDLGMNELQLKTMLMDEAKSRGDMTEAGIIAHEKLDQLMERFKKLSGRDRGTGEDSVTDEDGCSKRCLASPDRCGATSFALRHQVPPGNRPHSHGPSEETRKKLRGKRKKKK